MEKRVCLITIFKNYIYFFVMKNIENIIFREPKKFSDNTKVMFPKQFLEV